MRYPAIASTLSLLRSLLKEDLVSCSDEYDDDDDASFPDLLLVSLLRRA